MPGKRRVNYRARSAFWPCRDCRGNCSVNSVQCDSCDGWFHYACQELTLPDIEHLTRPESTFTCSACFKEEIGVYSYESSLQRLGLASQNGYQSLCYAARREYVVMPKEPIPEPVTYDSNFLHTDYVSRTIMDNYKMTHHGTPKVASPDGNCLFNAIATSLYGSEFNTTQLRVRTCIQMCMHGDTYKRRQDANDMFILSPSLEESTMDCARSNASSSVWTILAAADALAVTISSIYPPINGTRDFAYQKLNSNYVPTTVWTPSTQVKVLWTHTAKISNQGGIWTPNHFVPICESKTYPDLSFVPSFHSSPKVRTDAHITQESKTPVNAENNIEHTEEYAHSNLYNDSDNDDTGSKDNNQTNITIEQPEDIETPFEAPNNINKLPGSKFLSAKDIFEIVSQREHVFEECPPGDKSNSWFLVKSRKWSTSDNKRCYYDDCGVWDSSKGRGHKQLYLLSDNFRTIFFKNNAYCIKTRIKGQIVWTPIQPQPPADEIIEMCRYETVLKSNRNFKKHVSWFKSSTDDSLCDIVMYEYMGTYRVNEGEKIRTNPAVIQQIQSCQNMKPKEIFLEMNQNNSMEAPRDTRQIKNAQSRQKKKANPTPTNNIADEILQVLGMMNSHPFVQQVIHKKGQVPSIICYTEEQMLDFKLFLSKDGGTVGIDRTFNLGNFFVTGLVYKNTRVLRKDTKEPPIFIGPLLLHKDASFRTYYSFFSFLAAELKFESLELRIPENLSFGSDDEKALTKAVEDAFPNATRRLCTKHLKDNLKHYMQDKIGIDTKERARLMELIFGSEGMVDANTSLLFEEKSTNVKDDLKGYPKLAEYFDKQLKPRLKSFVNLPRRTNQETEQRLWTNNNSESINHVFKVAVNWKPRSTPELISKLHDCVTVQFLHLRGSLHGHGDYTLAPTDRHYFVSDQVWRCKGKEEKDNIFQTFLHDRRRKRKVQMVASTDGRYEVISKARSIAKKPAQRKRSRTERTSVRR